MERQKRYSKSEKTRQYIIEKVAPIFNEKGFAGTSLSDLTEATGLTKGAIYGNFKNKDEIAAEAFNHNLSMMGGTLQSQLAAAPTPLQKLYALATAFGAIYPQVMSIGGCPILNTLVDSDDTHEGLKNLSEKALNRLKNNIQQMLKDGISVGEIKPDTNPDTLSGLMLILIEGGLLIGKSLDNQKYMEESMKQLKTIIDNIRI